MNERITITDVTLRDGSHPMEHQFTPEQVASVAKALDQAGVPMIEVSHGDGVGGSSIQYGRSRYSEFELIRTAREIMTQAKLAFLYIPGLATSHEMLQAQESGADTVRVATHCTEADCSEEAINIAKSRGLQVVAFLMMAHMAEPTVLGQQAELMKRYGADVVYVVDSAGALLPEQAFERVEAVVRAVGKPVGFHGHNNLSMGVANSVAAIEAGAQWIDASLAGFGAGAGNTPLEVLVAVLDRKGIPTGIDLYAVMDAAETIARPMMPFPIRIDRDSLTIGVAGCYSTFLVHAQHASERFGVDTREILIEAGKRQLVAGQEDMLIDIAYQLSQAAVSGLR